jgi:hypothetical protein
MKEEYKKLVEMVKKKVPDKEMMEKLGVQSKATLKKMYYDALVLWGINSVTYFQAASFCSSSNLDSNSFRSSRVNFHSNGLETFSYSL